MTKHVKQVAQQCPNTKFAGRERHRHRTRHPHFARLRRFDSARSGQPGGSGCLSGRNIAGNSPRSGAKAIDLCNTGDPACGAGANVLAHLTHGFDGSATKAADFTAQKLR